MTDTLAPAAASATERAVEVYDFRKPATLSREHARVLEVAFDTFARQWGTQLTAKVRVLAEVEFGQVAVRTYDDHAASLPAHTALVLLSLPGTDARGVLQFPVPAALAWVSHMLGAARPQNLPDRVFTAIEQALVRRLVEDALDDLRYSFGPLLPEGIAVSGIQHASQFAQAAGKGELMVLADFAVRVGDRRSTATLAIPAAVLLPQLGWAEAKVTAADSRRMLDEQILSAPVEVSLRLDPAVMRPAEVLRLAVGDVIPLRHPQHRPLTLAVESEPIGSAAVGSHGARLAGVVTTVSRF